jgi:hypothetical protein
MWDKADIDFFKKNFNNMSDNDISKNLNKSLKSIQSKARRMNLKKSTNHIKKINKSKIENRWGDLKWTKEELDFLISNINILTNKEISKELKRTENSISSMCLKLKIKRDSRYTKEYIEKECLKYVTKQELRISDPNLYHWIYKNGKITDFTGHMMNISYSTPQLILCNILSKIIKSEFIYNDRNAIKPYEIDIYFPKFKIGFEYDGMYYHKDGSRFKLKYCNDKGIQLIIIDEKDIISRSFNGYVKNIKNKLIENLYIINKILNTKIKKSDIDNITVDINEVFKNLININNLKKICDKYNDYSKFIENERSTYNKLYYLGMLKQFTNHMTIKNDLKNIIESSNFYKEGDKVLIEYWYNDMITCVMINEIVGRKYKITHNIPESKIFNAPDELIKSTDIIDIYKERDNSISS